MQYRTDLALETVLRCSKLPNDATQSECRYGALTVHTLTLGDRSAAALGKPKGRYLTASFPPLTDNDRDFESFAEVLGKQLASWLPKEGTVLVVGLGNRAITPDALGPLAVEKVLATRHIQGEFARSMSLDDLRSVAVFTTGVLGDTGMESQELTEGICDRLHPCAVIAVDALAAGTLSRLGCTVQLSDTGISPGSGVGNDRAALNFETLGVPVIGIGVPTVVDAVTLATELTGTDGGERVTPEGRQMTVTPREIDLMIARASKLVAMIINAALQPSYSPLQLVAAAE